MAAGRFNLIADVWPTRNPLGIANFLARALNSGLQPADLPAGGNSSTLNFTEPANLLLRRLIIS
jgi:hypothetical protein